MLVDEAEIYIKAGNGGHGCVSFRREKFIPRGGPDGGDGGDGGSVYIRAAADVQTLLDCRGHHHWRAQNGQPGMGKNCTGRSGEDMIIDLPVGTLVYDRETDVLLIDLIEPGQRACVARAGKGGRGNRRFAGPTNRTPIEFEPGEPGQERWLRLALKLIADAGLVGLPNAGKSTLLSRLSHARPKIAAYPFTTLEPQLGIVELPGHRRLVLADIPGLIEGAHRGAGLGHAFLKHVERTGVLIHLVDVSAEAVEPSPQEAYRMIREELGAHSAALADKPELVVATKMDLTDAGDAARRLEDALGKPVMPVSAVTGFGLRRLSEAVYEMTSRHNAAKPPEPELGPIDLSTPPHLRNA